MSEVLDQLRDVLGGVLRDRGENLTAYEGSLAAVQALALVECARALGRLADLAEKTRYAPPSMHR